VGRAGIEVGQVVGVAVGDLVLRATVVADRGPLGPDGERVVRLVLGREGDRPRRGYRLELPVSMLLPAPPETPA